MTSKRFTFYKCCNLLSWAILCLGLVYVMVQLLLWPAARATATAYFMKICWHLGIDITTIRAKFSRAGGGSYIYDGVRLWALPRVFYVLIAFLTVRLIGLLWLVFRRRRRTLA